MNTFFWSVFFAARLESNELCFESGDFAGLESSGYGVANREGGWEVLLSAMERGNFNTRTFSKTFEEYEVV